MTDYPWSRSDAVEDPSTYYYTAFRGPELLDAWQASRRRAVPDGVAARAAVPGPETVDDITAGERIPLSLLIEAAYEDGATGRDDARLDLACRRFEVSRRLYVSYAAEPPHRVTGADPEYAPEPYIRFGEALAARWRRAPDLRDLNALLKLCDLFAALTPAASGPQRDRMAAIVETERAAVASVSAGVEVGL